jgi:hypothetical protein
MRYAPFVSWLYNLYLNTVTINKESKAFEKLLLVLVKGLAKFGEVSKIEAIYYTTMYSLVYGSLVLLGDNVVNYEAHLAAIGYKGGKTLGKDADSSRTEVPQLKVKLLAVLQTVVEELFW